MSEIEYAAIQNVPLMLLGIQERKPSRGEVRDMALILKDTKGNVYQANFKTEVIYDKYMKKAYQRIRPDKFAAGDPHE